MISAEEWYKKFHEEYKIQNFDDWWKALRKPNDTAWTYRMAELLRVLALKMGHEMEYEIGTDFSWYEKGSECHSVAIEHENDIRGVLDDEVPKLLESGAPLKVLVTYSYWPKKVEELIKIFGEKHIQIVKEKHSEEFLFVIRRMWEKAGSWIAYVFKPSGPGRPYEL